MFLYTIESFCHSVRLKPKTTFHTERRLDFGDFDYSRGAALTEADFFEKPLLLLLGQTGAGKTSFVKFLTDANYAGMRVGGFDAGKTAAPTTDSFVVVTNDATAIGAAVLTAPNNGGSGGAGDYYSAAHNRSGVGVRGGAGGSSRRVIPGNVLCSDPRFPFRELTRFGNGFLKKFNGAASSSPVLDHFVIVDTPGVSEASAGNGTSTAKKKGGNNNGAGSVDYDSEGVLKWFVDRSDCILVFVDALEMEFCDEFEKLLASLKVHMDKTVFVLNKVRSGW